MKHISRIGLALFAILLLSLVIVPSLIAQDTTSEEEANKAVLLAFWEAEAARRYDRLSQFFTPDLVRHSVATSAVMPPGFQIVNRSDYRQFLRDTAAMFPDYYTVPQMLVAEGETIAFYALFVGTFAENGNRVEVPIVGFARFEDGLIAEMWVEWDNVTWDTQMDATPPQYTDVPISGIEDIVGVYRIYGNGWAWFLEYTADGVSYVGSLDCAPDNCVEHGDFVIEGNQLISHESQLHPQCREARYNVFKVMDGQTQVGLRFEAVGDDCSPERREALDASKIIYPVVREGVS